MAVDWLVVAAALLAGFMGGAHCAAMCGGIATGFSAMAFRTGWRQAMEPNVGRVFGYVVAGAAAGGLGSGILAVARSEWLTLGLRMAVGAVLILAALRLLDRRGRLAFVSGAGNAAWRALRPLQGRLLPADRAWRRLALGMLWGWMPCGLSTLLLTAAWLQADAIEGALTMAAFGIGTLPVMLPLTWSGARIGQRLRSGRWRAAAGSFVLLSGLMTLAAPWLAELPVLHGALKMLGCGSLA